MESQINRLTAPESIPGPKGKIKWKTSDWAVVEGMGICEVINVDGQNVTVKRFGKKAEETVNIDLLKQRASRPASERLLNSEKREPLGNPKDKAAWEWFQAVKSTRGNFFKVDKLLLLVLDIEAATFLSALINHSQHIARRDGFYWNDDDMERETGVSKHPSRRLLKLLEDRKFILTGMKYAKNSDGSHHNHRLIEIRYQRIRKAIAEKLGPIVEAIRQDNGATEPKALMKKLSKQYVVSESAVWKARQIAERGTVEPTSESSQEPKTAPDPAKSERRKDNPNAVALFKLLKRNGKTSFPVCPPSWSEEFNRFSAPETEISDVIRIMTEWYDEEKFEFYQTNILDAKSFGKYYKKLLGFRLARQKGGRLSTRETL